MLLDYIYSYFTLSENCDIIVLLNYTLECPVVEFNKSLRHYTPTVSYE